MRQFVPDGLPYAMACGRTTHLAIGAHADDLEIMAYSGIAECFEQDDKWFSGITVTDGAGSPRSGAYQDFSDTAMRELRADEQEAAARLGHYSSQTQLGLSSSALSDGQSKTQLIDRLRGLILACRPEVLFLHNPFDRHPTHLRVLACCFAALRLIPAELRPPKVLGCEVWGSLDWLPEERKVILDTSPHPELAEAVLAVFKSQVEGGKDYVSAALGRRRANATFCESHTVDTLESCSLALDMSDAIRLGKVGALRDLISQLSVHFSNQTLKAWIDANG